MTVDVLICAKERSNGIARRIASALSTLRVASVTAIEGDSAWDSPALDTAARQARAVLVVWNNDCFPHGGDISGFVRRAAAVGRKRGVLISTLAEPTALDPPFSEKPARSLLTWSAGRGDRAEARREWLGLLGDLGTLLQRPGLAEFSMAQDSGDDAALRAWAGQYRGDPLAKDVWEKFKAKAQLGETMASTRSRAPMASETVRQGPRLRRGMRTAQLAALGAGSVVVAGALAIALMKPGPPSAAAADGAPQAVAQDFGIGGVRVLWDGWIGGLGATSSGGAAASQSGPSATGPLADGHAGASTAGSSAARAGASGAAGGAAASTEQEQRALAAQILAADARLTPAPRPAPIVRDPAGLPDFSIFRECEACPDMVVLPGGAFIMGSPATEAGRGEDEDNRAGTGGAPVQVTLPRFAMARFETTWDQWNACVAAGACDGAAVEEAGGHNGWGAGRRPLIEVNGADEPQAYAAFVSAQSGSAYRLPSEAEWEYAARAGSTTAFPWGETMSRGQGNYGADECCTGGVGGPDRWLNTAPVGQFPANAFGLFDMHGNVMEWVADCYRPSIGGPAAMSIAYTTGNCSARVLRGGSWDTSPEQLRSAYRMRLNPDRRFNFTGFRLARHL
jgi:formylglycine-generating enzyme required for sulfatase activity